MNYFIRKMNKDDSNAIANVITLAWNETYKGIVPDWFLTQLKENENDRALKLYNDFDINNNNHIILIVDNRVVGFITYGISHDIEFNDCGEIYALYIINGYKGYGFGKKLVESAKIELKKLGFNKMVISCLKDNPSNEFYKHIGGVYIKDSVYKKFNLPENVYFYDNI